MRENERIIENREERKDEEKKKRMRLELEWEGLGWEVENMNENYRV